MQPSEQLKLEAYNWQKPGTLQVILRNIGSRPITLGSLYLNGVLLLNQMSQPIAVADTLPLILALTSGYMVGQAYTLKATSSSGAQFIYSMTCGATR